MKKFFILFLIGTASLHLTSQTADFNPPNYKMIKKETSRKNSAFYYPKIFERYQNGDTTLTLEDYWFLYYGFSYQPSYSPYSFSPLSDSVAKLLNKPNIDTNDYYQIIRLTHEVLKKTPFSLRDLNRLLFAYEQTNQKEMAIKTFDKLDKTIGTILNSGDGFSEQTAMYVIRIGHEYDILNVLGLDFTGPQSLTKTGCDYLEVGENEFGIPGLYFNVERILDANSNLFK